MGFGKSELPETAVQNDVDRCPFVKNFRTKVLKLPLLCTYNTIKKRGFLSNSFILQVRNLSFTEVG